MFAVVLILVHDFNAAQTFFQHLHFLGTASVAAISVSAPFQKDFREILPIFPVTRIDKGQQSGTIASGTGTEDTQFGKLFRCFGGIALSG